MTACIVRRLLLARSGIGVAELQFGSTMNQLGARPHPIEVTDRAEAQRFREFHSCDVLRGKVPNVLAVGWLAGEQLPNHRLGRLRVESGYWPKITCFGSRAEHAVARTTTGDARLSRKSLQPSLPVGAEHSFIPRWNKKVIVTWR